MKRARHLRNATLLGMTLFALVILCGRAAAQEIDLSQETYLRPPADIANIVLAPWHENVTMSSRSPDGKYFLRQLSDGLPPVASFAKKFYRLGGVQIDPEANRNRRFTTRAQTGFELIDYMTGETITVDPPRGATVSNPTWSPDGSQLAYFAHFTDATHIYVTDVSNGRSRRITPPRTPVVTTLTTSIDWTSDGQYIMTALVPDGRGNEPVEPAVPTQPMVRITEEGENALRVYASLLESPYEKDLLEYYGTSQLAMIEVRRGRVTEIGEPDMYRSVGVSPSGEHLQVSTMERPFSYIVPVSNFGNVEEIWDLEGTVLTELDRNELRTGIQGGNNQGDQNGQDQKRSLSWRPDGQGMSFLQMEPRAQRERGSGEEPQQEEAEEEEEEEPRKDRVMLWVAPFDSTSMSVVYENETRMGSVRYSEDGQVLFITEGSGGGGGGRGGGGQAGGGGGGSKLYAVYLDDPETQYVIYEQRSSDFYNSPGSIQTKRGPLGPSVVRISSDGQSVYLSGTQYFEDPMENAPQAFLHRVEIRTGERDTLWTSADDMNERILQIMDDDANELMISREGPTTIADSYLLNTSTGAERKLTNNINYAQEISDGTFERFQVTRVDGFKFWVSILRPADQQEGTRMPAMFWFYPREYTSQENYDEGGRRYNKNAFRRVSTRSMEILTKLGYIFVSPDCPIVGDQGQRNDNYVQDLRNSLTAVVDELDKRGYVDRERLALGGHSYGAFGTANAMIHTPYFKAGIAGDGNYNRLLTPMGFQSERRLLWEGREVYTTMSPVLWANQLNGALLMYHGMDDQNTGTAPFHAPKMFHALNGLGKTAALYMYPYEDHGPATEETTLDLWARWIAWLEKYVKNAGMEETEEKEPPPGRRGGGL
jgi:dipeptidyl aminopeptidase/acylaminoacyl peptidase